MALTELSSVLWRERDVMEVLWFKLEEERLLLEAGAWGWLGHSSREMETVVDELGDLELSRAVAVAAGAAELDLPPDVGLQRLAAAARPPWSAVLDGHFKALRRLADDVLALAEGNRPLLEEGAAEVRRQLEAAAEPSARLLLEIAGFDAALATNRRVLQPSLVEALGAEPAPPLSW